MQLGCKRKAIVIDLTLSSEDESSEADGDACELTLISGDKSSDDTATVASKRGGLGTGSSPLWMRA